MLGPCLRLLVIVLAVIVDKPIVKTEEFFLASISTFNRLKIQVRSFRCFDHVPLIVVIISCEQVDFKDFVKNVLAIFGIETWVVVVVMSLIVTQ